MPAYSSSVSYQRGETIVYGKRERPHLIFDPVSGVPTHLSTGVCLNPNYTKCNDNPGDGYYDRTFTSVQPIKRAALWPASVTSDLNNVELMK